MRPSPTAYEAGEANKPRPLSERYEAGETGPQALPDASKSPKSLKRVIEPGKLVQGRWRISRENPIIDDENSTTYKARDIKDSRDVCIKIYRYRDPFTVQKFRRSVEVLLTFRGRFTSRGCRVEGSQNLDLLLQELRAHSSFADFAAGQSFMTHMNFRHCYAEIISFSHDKDWMPAVDKASNLLFIVMELGDISLRERLTDCIHSKQTLKPQEINEIHWALITMICGLMTEGYMHLDVKPRSIIRYKSERGKDVWKLMDLDGVVPSGNQMRLQDLSYALEYAPPELARLYLASQREGGRIKLVRSMNVWSIGMCLMEVSALMPVYNVKYSWYQKWKEETRGVGKFLASVAGQRDALGMDRMISKELREALAYVSPDLASLMDLLLVRDEKKRISITQCLLHKWFIPRRKSVFDARWGVEHDEEDEENNEEELGLAGEKTMKPKKLKEEELLPNLDTQEELRAYIKARAQGREYKGVEPSLGPSELSVKLSAKGSAKGDDEEPPPLALPEPPPAPPQADEDGAKKSKACVLM